MESEAAAVPGYLNRPTGAVLGRRVRLPVRERPAGRRSRMRIALVALRAYEQRAERRARMHAWLLTRSAQPGPAAPAANG